MTDKSSPAEFSKEELIIKAMKLTLTDIIRDTTTQPGMRHPLSEGTIDGIRKCLFLISERETELAAAAGRPMNDRPRYVDEPQTSVVVPFDMGDQDKKPDDD